ncbi:MAG: S8 family serine peptidase [Bacteroidota bacterium]
MLSLLSFSTLLAVLGLGLVAWDASQNQKQPVRVLIGLGLVVTAVTWRLWTGVGVWGTLTGLSIDIGLAFLAGGFVLARRETQPSAFYALSALGFGAALAFGALGYFFDPAPIAGDDVAPEANVEGAYDSFLLELGPDDEIDEVLPLLEQHQARYERAFPEVTLIEDENLARFFLIFVPRDLKEKLMDLLRDDLENVDTVEGNDRIEWLMPVEKAGLGYYASEAELRVDDPRVAEQWGFDAMGGHAAIALLEGLEPARKARVAIVDTGVDAAHEDVRDVFTRGSARTDENGHGSHCAGIAGGVANNGIGIASLNLDGRFIEVSGYAALGADGFGTMEQIAQSVIDAAEDDADVISMSLGAFGPFTPKVLSDAIAYAQRRGAIVVASAGNSNVDAYNHYPSNIEGVIAVAAVDQRLDKASFSNMVGSLTRPIAAPGVDILSLKNGGDYVQKSGTSMAAPMVAGVLGVMRALQPDLSAEDAYDMLVASGQDVQDSDQVGRVIRADAVLAAMLEPAL